MRRRDALVALEESVMLPPAVRFNMSLTQTDQLQRTNVVMYSGNYSLTRPQGDAENARPKNDGQRKLWVWKMQDWKMTDSFPRCRLILLM